MKHYFDSLRRFRMHTMTTLLMLAAVLYITGFELKLLRTESLVRQIKLEGINYDAFRDLRISREVLNKVSHKVDRLIHQHPGLKDRHYIDPVGYLTFNMLVGDYNPMTSGVTDEEIFLRGIGRVSKLPGFQELYGYYNVILKDLKYFPVPKAASGEADITYDNTWYVLRSYGGNRRHEGTDLMASNNLRGYFPVVSMTDGVVENIGWLEKGGNRVGIRSESGGYFYYAHLDTYAPGLKAGSHVIAGQLLGFMGDSGYGTEGTTGMFDVHLHLGIYIETSIGDMSINPYYILKLLENNRTTYVYN